MYLLNEFGLFGDKNKDGLLLPKMGSKIGAIAYGTKRQLQGAKKGFKLGIKLGKEEKKRYGRKNFKNPVIAGAKNTAQLGAQLGKELGTIEGSIKGYKKGVDLQNKLSRSK